MVSNVPMVGRTHLSTWISNDTKAVNGLSAAVFDSPCGELLIHEPSFLAWLLGLSGRATPRATRRERAG